MVADVNLERFAIDRNDDVVRLEFCGTGGRFVLYCFHVITLSWPRLTNLSSAQPPAGDLLSFQTELVSFCHVWATKFVEIFLAHGCVSKTSLW